MCLSEGSVRHLCPSVTEFTFSAPELIVDYSGLTFNSATCQEFSVTFPVICTAVSSAVLFCGSAEFSFDLVGQLN